MAVFSATDAAFEGFKMIGKRPLAVLSWGLIYLLFFACTFGFFFLVAGPQFEQIGAGAQTGEPPDPAKALALFSTIFPFEMLIILGVYAMRAIIATSAYRVVLRPDEGAPFNIGVGLAELYQLVVYIALGVMTFLAAIVLMIVCVPIGFGIAYGPAQLRVPLFITLGIVAFATVIYVAVRFSLAGPATFDRKAIQIFESWTLTRGVFWHLLGAYVLQWAVLMVVYILAFIVAVLALIMLGAVLGFGSLAALQGVTNPPLQMGQALGAAAIPAVIIGAVSFTLMSGFAYAMMYGPGAHAYRAITGAAPAQ